MSNSELLEKYYDFFLELQEKFGVNDDCMQIIYLSFLQTSNKKLSELDRRDELKFWIIRVIKNNWFSKSSRYYYQYKKYYELVKEQLPQQIDEDDWLEEEG